MASKSFFFIAIFLVGLAVYFQILIKDVSQEDVVQEATYAQSSSSTSSFSPVNKNSDFVEKKIEARNEVGSDVSAPPKNLLDVASNRVEQDIEKMKSDPSYNSYLQSQFEYESEPYNEVWAEKRSDELNSFLKDVNINDDFRVKNVSCRSKTCQIQVTYRSESDIPEVSRLLTMSMINGSLKNLFSPYVRTDFDASNSSALIYLSDAY